MLCDFTDQLSLGADPGKLRLTATKPKVNSNRNAVIGKRTTTKTIKKSMKNCAPFTHSLRLKFMVLKGFQEESLGGLSGFSDGAGSKFKETVENDA